MGPELVVLLTSNGDELLRMDRREDLLIGIRVTAIAPGMVETPMTKGMNQKARDAVVAAIPVARIGAPEDLWLVAAAAEEAKQDEEHVHEVEVEDQRAPTSGMFAWASRKSNRCSAGDRVACGSERNAT
ncbi:MAG: 3-oxoacyl-[acyl-carrier protein] reductase [Labilithrix sp.]|nr:3-oxoacyl-[acyl-carrier protein] reductase [Labilithrix sp.]